MEDKIFVAKIIDNGNTFYTRDLTHPKAVDAEIVQMTLDEYYKIPATQASRKFFE